MTVHASVILLLYSRLTFGSSLFCRTLHSPVRSVKRERQFLFNFQIKMSGSSGSVPEIKTPTRLFAPTLMSSLLSLAKDPLVLPAVRTLVFAPRRAFPSVSVTYESCVSSLQVFYYLLFYHHAFGYFIL